MKLSSLSRNFVFICVAVFLKCIEPQVFNSRPCSRMKSSVKTFHLNKLSGTWYEVGRYYSNVKKNLICSSVEVIIKDDGFVFVHSSLDIQRQKSLVLAIEEGYLLLNTDNYSPPILKTTDFATKTTVNYQVLDTDYTTYAILWSCETLNSGFGSKVFAWVLTRDSQIQSLQMQKWLFKRLDTIGINSALLLETPRIGCEVINTNALRDMLNYMSQADDALQWTNKAEVACPKGHTCTPIAKATTETPSYEPISKETTTPTPSTKLPILINMASTSTTETIHPKRYICYPEDTNSDKPSDDSLTVTEEEKAPYLSLNLTETGRSPSNSSKIATEPTTKFICPNGNICSVDNKPDLETEMPNSSTTTFICPKGYKCTIEPVIINERNLETEILVEPSDESQNLQTKIDKLSGYSPSSPTDESENLETEIQLETESPNNLTTASIHHNGSECTDPNCVSRASCYATTHACAECNCPTCPPGSHSEENKTKCEPQPIIATTTDGFTVGDCGNGTTTTTTTTTYDYRAMPKTTQPMAAEDVNLEITMQAGNSSEENTTQSDNGLKQGKGKIFRSPETTPGELFNNGTETSIASESMVTTESFSDTNTQKIKKNRKGTKRTSTPN